MDNPEEEKVVNKPDPMKIMKTLINLYADQMGVTITCKIVAGGKSEWYTTE